MQVYNEETGEWEDQDAGGEEVSIDDGSSGWVDNGDGTWTAPDGVVVDEEGNEVTEDFYTGGGEADTGEEFTVGWTDNGDGSWTWTDENGDMTRINEDGSEWNPDGAALDPVEVVGEKEEETDTGGETKTILGQVFTKQADGSWLDADGFKYSQEDMNQADAGRDDALWEGWDFGIGDNGDGVYTQTDRNGNTITRDAKTGQVLSSYDIDGNSTTGTDNEVKYTRNPDGTMTETHPDGLVITTNRDGTKTTQNGPGGSTHTTTPDGKTTQTTPAGVNPNGPVTPPTTTGPGGTTTPPGGAKTDDKKTDGLPDWLKKLIAAGTGIAGLKAIADNWNAPKDAGYQGSVDMGRDWTSKLEGMHDKMGTRQYPANEQPVGIAAVAPPPGMAAGGIAQAFAKGGPTKPRYLRGETDGMADQIKARIDGGQEARLAHGEFVIPADVVSHLGNGNSDAGAKKLYAMMDKLRMARTGTKKQGRQINPDKFLPGMGGKRMASGGITDAVPRFNGTTGSTVTTTAAAPTASVSNLSTWAGPYVTNMLSDANAIGNAMVSSPQHFVYQGPRAAGASALQTQGFNAAGSLGVNSNLTNAATQVTSIGDKMKGMTYDATKFENVYKPADPYETTKFSSQEFTGDQVSKYMNPYLQQSLDPQLAEARRAAEITRMTNAGRLVGSGAFGGGRQAIMEAEGDRNLHSNLANITGQGYNTAYDKATQQFNAAQQQRLAADQATESSKQFGANFGMNNNVNSANFQQKANDASEQSKQYGAKYGLDALQGAANVYNVAGGLGSQIGAQERANIATQMDAGGVQRGIAQDSLNASMAKFNETAALPGQAIKLKASVLPGLPITTTTPQAAPVPLDALAASAGLALTDLYKLLGDTNGSKP